MPTFDAENAVRYAKESRPFVSVSSDGQLLPAVKQVIGIVASHNLVLATGHSSSEECLMLIREARRQGVRHMVVTHAMMAPIHMTIPQMREAARMGAYIEFVYNGLIGPYKEFDFEDYAKAIRAVGPESRILASDLGQVVNPVHPEGLKAYFAGLRQQGISESEIARMPRRTRRACSRDSFQGTGAAHSIARPAGAYCKNSARKRRRHVLMGGHRSLRGERARQGYDLPQAVWKGASLRCQETQ
jgi:predicted dehydrogenase